MFSCCGAAKGETRVLLRLAGDGRFASFPASLSRVPFFADFTRILAALSVTVPAIGRADKSQILHLNSNSACYLYYIHNVLADIS